MSASDKAYEHVKTGILAGDIPPGTFVTEGRLAEEIGVSRTPVREALLRLQAEGMVELFPKKGALVTAPTPRETQEIFEARALIEEWAAAQMWPRRADAIPALRAHLDEMADLMRTGDVSAFSAADRAFHEVIVDAGSNSVISRQYSHLRDRQIVIVAGNLRGDKPRMTASLRQHRELLHLLESGTKSQFVRACREHVDYAVGLAGTR
ncbi:GntR family transcriptional regulator [Flexivirga caeni]|uniref:GntR family transcriptional regulator n=1 Tax=Flexivirga caeni TaxID=2294115 RepID=A0A3M9M951_9MICO|nr:GntR family transcriptional regulator [Flexivirga caeni]RNI21707.1 GntR family transcriptional regulator [Flexivirga caeni]